ncbi:hypothetical protein BVV20_07550 [Xanthomonas oryzae pv. oryzae]|nr:hypothetical protein BVV20_07550 [Xanthomonas oryzae pv. oryzae]
MDGLAACAAMVGGQGPCSQTRRSVALHQINHIIRSYKDKRANASTSTQQGAIRIVPCCVSTS